VTREYGGKRAREKPERDAGTGDNPGEPAKKHAAEGDGMRPELVLPLFEYEPRQGKEDAVTEKVTKED